MLEKLKSRLSDLLKLAEQSVQNHNTLLGRVAEVQELISFATKEGEQVVSDVKQEVKEVQGELVNNTPESSS